MKDLTPLGHARVYRDPASGELVVDTDSLRRSQFAGDDLGAWDDDDDFEGDFDDDDDVGFLRRDPGRRRQRIGRKRDRNDRRHERRDDRLDRKEDRLAPARAPEPPKRAESAWGRTAVGASEQISRGGPVSLRLRLQHDFRAEDVTFSGSAPGATVNSIFFGDRVVWSSSSGIDASVFASNSQMRGLLEGQDLRAGLDITINGALPDAGTFSATLIGLKPVSPTC